MVRPLSSSPSPPQGLPACGPAGTPQAPAEARSGPPTGGADPQTGCLNESAMASRLDEEIARAQRHGTALCCLLLALDDLDTIALRYGRSMSESTLGHVGSVLRGEFRRFDRVAYLGRGEFVVILAGASGAQAEVVGRRVLERVHQIKLAEGADRLALRASAGLGEWRQGQGAWELIAVARAALLRAGPREADGDNGPHALGV